MAKKKPKPELKPCQLCAEDMAVPGERFCVERIDEANAILMAAAPEMLAALQRQHENIEQWLAGGPAAGPDESREIADQIREAIEAATMPVSRAIPSQTTLQETVDRFNRDFPVGTKLILRKDNGEIETEVKAPAEVLHGHSAVGWFVGVSGCYSIDGDRIRVMP